jgi:hypothetical protein
VKVLSPACDQRKRLTCDQRKRLTCNNFRAYSPQTADVSRDQPDATHTLPGPPSWVPPNKNYGDGMPAATTPSTSWAPGSHSANYATFAKPSPRPPSPVSGRVAEAASRL